MAKVIILRGLPGSGKSTWAFQFLKSHPEAVRVSRDDLRAMLRGEGYTPDAKLEEIVTVMERAAIVDAVKADHTVIVDAMHLRPQYIRAIYKLVPADVPIRFEEFPEPVDICVYRDMVRGRDGRSVGEAVIRSIASKYYPKERFLPAPERDTVVVPAFRAYVPDETLPKAIIVDIDGTLAKMAGRSPYDSTRYHEDTLHAHVRDIVRDHYDRGVNVIVVSGRSGTPEARLVTEEWLTRMNVPYDEFYMRADGDERKDDVVKDEIFENHIAGRFNILFALDDRQRVVDMWRAKGIVCLQVAEGNF